MKRGKEVVQGEIRREEKVEVGEMMGRKVEKVIGNGGTESRGNNGMEDRGKEKK